MRIKIPYLTTSIERDIVNTLYLAPLWWVLGFSIFIYQAVALWLLIKLTVTSIVKSEPLRVPKVASFLILLIMVYGLSLLINYPYNELTRTVASFYNFSFWIMGLALIIAVYNFLNMESIRALSKALRFNVIICGVLAVISALFWLLGHKEIVYPTPLLRLAPLLANIPLLRASATMSFIKTNWFAFRPLPRTAVMAPYATALAFFLAMSVPLAYTCYMGRETGKRIERTGFILLAAATLMLTFSRTDTLALVLASLMAYILVRKHRLGFIILAASALFLAFPLLMEMFDYISSLRAGSSRTRFAAYKAALDMAFQGNPLIGIGVKPREEGLKIPIGSHSMYLSLLLKSGFIGLCAFIAFQLHIFRTWFGLARLKMERKTKVIFISVGISLISAGFILFTQDLDAPQFVSFVYFVLVGILTVVSREVLSGRECKKG